MNIPAIIHDKDKRCFSLSYNGSEAVLEYRLSSCSDGVTEVDFNRTYVPVEYRGKGFAEALVHEGLGWARQEGYNIKASCWYVQKFIA